MTSGAGQQTGGSRWPALSRAELIRAGKVLARLEQVAAHQRVAIARMAAADLAELGRDQVELESELRTIIENAGGADGAEPATAAERAALAAQSARVRRACQHNLGLLAYARRSVSLLLGLDDDRAAYDRRARLLTRPIQVQARVRAL